MIRLLFALFVLFPLMKATSFETKNSPIKITSDNLKINYDKNLVIYYGKVDVTQKNFNIKCHKMFIYYGEEGTNSAKGSLNSTSLEKIEFFQDVVLTKESKSATGDYAIFDPKVNKVTLLGNVTLKDKKSYLKGETVVYDMTTKLFNVTNHKNSQKGRIRIVVDDEQVNQGK